MGSLLGGPLQSTVEAGVVHLAALLRDHPVHQAGGLVDVPAGGGVGARQDVREPGEALDVDLR
eukprot:4547226-Alexandrium_andersonii.AAC.1